MRKIVIATSATIFKDISERSSEDTMLMNKVIEVRETANAPYSKFHMDAA